MKKAFLLCRNSKYVLVITGFLYVYDSSGTSKVVKAHEVIFNESGIDYIVLHPISLKGYSTDCYGITVNKKYLGIITHLELINFLYNLQVSNKKAIGILIHHLIHNKIENIKSIIEGFKCIPVVVYLHDFYTCCTNYNLLRNNEYFCAKDCIRCNGCLFEKKRIEHFYEIKAFFKYLIDNVKFVAPSDFTKDIWIKFYPEYEDKVVIIPHLKEHGKCALNTEFINYNQSLRIAYIGAQLKIKGWPLVKNIFNQCIVHQCNYQYYYFGSGSEVVKNVKNINVQIHLQGKNAMINNLRKYRIDVVLLPAICPETYSYTMHESFAANSFVITLESSGNIATVIRNFNKGKIFSDATTISAYLLNEKILRKDVNSWKRQNEGPLYYDDNDEIINLYKLNKTYDFNKGLTRINVKDIIKKHILILAYNVKNTLNYLLNKGV